MTPENDRTEAIREDEPEDDEELDFSQLAGISEHSAHEAGITPHGAIGVPEPSRETEPEGPNVPSMHDFHRGSLLRATQDSVVDRPTLEDPEVNVVDPDDAEPED